MNHKSINKILGAQEIHLNLPNRFLEKNFNKIKPSLYKKPLKNSEKEFYLFYNSGKEKLFAYNNNERLTTNDLLGLKEVQLILDYWIKVVKNRKNANNYLENKSRNSKHEKNITNDTRRALR